MRYADKIPEQEQEEAWSADAVVVDVDLVLFACVQAFWDQSDRNIIAARAMYNAYDADGNGVLSFEVRYCPRG